MKKAINFNDVAIVSVKENDYRIHFWYMNKDDAINKMKTSAFIKIIKFFIIYKKKMSEKDVLSKK